MNENKRYKRIKIAKWFSVRSLVLGLLLTVRSARHDTHVERSVNVLPKVVGGGGLPGTPVSTHRESWQSRVGLAPLNWPFHQAEHLDLTLVMR